MFTQVKRPGVDPEDPAPWTPANSTPITKRHCEMPSGWDLPWTEFRLRPWSLTRFRSSGFLFIFFAFSVGRSARAERRDSCGGRPRASRRLYDARNGRKITRRGALLSPRSHLGRLK